MNLTQFKSADDAVRLTIRLSVGYCVLLTLAFVSCLIYLSVQIEKAQAQALVIDRKGEVYTASAVPSLAMRKYEYMNHVKSFVKSWYAFDENTYEKHVKYALNLIGNKGKELLNEYNDVNMQNSLIQKNIRYDVSIRDIQIDTQTIPTTGKISFTQTGYRPGAASPVKSWLNLPFTMCHAVRTTPTGPRSRTGLYTIRPPWNKAAMPTMRF